MKRKAKITKSKKASLSKKFIFFLLKLFLIIAAIAFIYGIYLDQRIKEKIDGNVWELPAAVYGQITELKPFENYSIDDIRTILNNSQYRYSKIAIRPGEYVINHDSIEIYRRPFHFPSGKEPAIKVKIFFSQGKITKIVNNQNRRSLNILRIDPCLITMMHSSNNEQRLFVPLKDFPDSLVQILIATEDKRFYEHDGISIYSIFRAIYVNLVSGKTVQGGSTLTQQLVKNLFLTNERSYLRKFCEAYMSIILDSRYSKERILELYLNEVYFGQYKDQEIHGFPLASLYYFGRPVNELSLDQQAMLVGMIKGASYYNPWTQPQRVFERRNTVLKLIKEQNIIDEELFNLLSSRPLSVLPKEGVLSSQPAFIQLVKHSLREQLGERANHLSGMKIFTSFSPVVQNAAETAIITEIEHLRTLSRNNELQTAMVVVDRQNGEIKAVIGGADPQYAGFNRALFARRPIGSLAKPPTYLTALSQPENYQLNTKLDDKPLSIKLNNGVIWQPNNFDKQYNNQVLLIDALVKSLNIPSVNLGLSLGLKTTEKTLVALGVPNTEIKSVPSRFLGSLELTPIETAQMYQVIGNGGKKAPLTILKYVLTESGTLIYQSKTKTEQTVPVQAAYLTTYAMQKVAEYGTAQNLNKRYGYAHLAAKTGTTNDLRDSWFVGIDGKYVTVIWVGLDNHKTMQLTGATGALKIYQQYLYENMPQAFIQNKPADIKMMAIDAQGDWQCHSTGARILPIWIKNNMSLCSNAN